jgi:hypothetical protein
MSARLYPFENCSSLNHSGALALFVQRVVYKHCVRRGQVKCGQIAALRAPQIFKRAFEIVMTGKIAIIYQS